MGDRGGVRGSLRRMIDDTKVLRGLLAAVVDLADLTHAGPRGRVLLAAAVAGTGCSDGVIPPMPQTIFHPMKYPLTLEIS